MKYTWCRAFAHRWVHYTVSSERRILLITQICEECLTTRTCELKRTGECSHWRYKYPADYGSTLRVAETRRLARVEYMTSYA